MRRDVFRHKVAPKRSSVIPLMKPGLGSLLREVVDLGLELFVATYGSMASAAASIFLLYPLAHALNAGLSFHQFNRILSVPYFPLQIAFALADSCFQIKPAVHHQGDDPDFGQGKSAIGPHSGHRNSRVRH